MNITIQDEIKSKFRNGAVCPHCGSNSVNKYGFFQGKQRFRCKDCKKTFNLYTKTVLSGCHYKDKWESFIGTCRKNMTLRQAEKKVGISYVTLFYWRHKIMTILNEESDTKLHGILELGYIKLKYIDKYRNREMENDIDESDGKYDLDISENENLTTGGALNVIFTFLYQRSDRLESYIYKENRGAKEFIYDLSDKIDKNSMVCLGSNYPFRYHLLYKKIKVAEKSINKYRRTGCFNSNSVKKYLGQFRSWVKVFRGVSSKNLVKYAALFRANMVYENMECIILSSIREYESLTNQYSTGGVLGV